MAGVNVPQKKPGMLGTLLTVGGAVAGGSVGGPAGAAAGANLGSTAGGMLGANKQGPSGVQSNAVQRRIDTMQPSQDNAAQLAAAQNALASLPEPYQKQYGPALQRARAIDSGVA